MNAGESLTPAFVSAGRSHTGHARVTCRSVVAILVAMPQLRTRAWRARSGPPRDPRHVGCAAGLLSRLWAWSLHPPGEPEHDRPWMAEQGRQLPLWPLSLPAIRASLVSEPTAEALAWRERADKLRTEGVRTGFREICPACLHPVPSSWVDGGARCMCVDAVERAALWREEADGRRHGLGGVPVRLAAGAINYD